MKVRPLQIQDAPAVLAIVDGLREWFTEDARRKSMPVDLRHQRGFVAAEGDLIAGFISLYIAEGKLNIGWLGVDKAKQRQGIGKLLIQQAEGLARDLGITELATYTLGDSVDYAPYEQTRAFYLKQGFEIYQRVQTDNPHCREEVRLRKSVPATARNRVGCPLSFRAVP
jgi:GNAT superfamily N-acetyltransferase